MEERIAELESIRAEPIRMMARLAELPKTWCFTRKHHGSSRRTSTSQGYEQSAYPRRLVGVEAVTAEGLNRFFQGLQLSGDGLVKQLQTFRQNGVHVLGSFIFGLPTDKPDTSKPPPIWRKRRRDLRPFVMMTPFPGTVDFLQWEKKTA